MPLILSFMMDSGILGSVRADVNRTDSCLMRTHTEFVLQRCKMRRLNAQHIMEKKIKILVSTTKKYHVSSP